MSSPFIGECRLVGFNFPPNGWQTCQGQLLPIAENDALFNLIGTTYGGDGQSTFALPDLQGRAPIHQGTGPGGTGFTIGEKAGVETVTLTTQQLPVHTHTPIGSKDNGNTNLLNNAVLSANSTKVYNAIGASPGTPLNANAVTPQGGSQPHENLQPYLTMNWVISLFGVFPSPT
jgi:microcystin-dependent protein